MDRSASKNILGLAMQCILTTPYGGFSGPMNHNQRNNGGDGGGDDDDDVWKVS